jgi:hypothetical protein
MLSASWEANFGVDPARVSQDCEVFAGLPESQDFIPILLLAPMKERFIAGKIVLRS